MVGHLVHVNRPIFQASYHTLFISAYVQRSDRIVTSADSCPSDLVTHRFLVSYRRTSPYRVPRARILLVLDLNRNAVISAMSEIVWTKHGLLGSLMERI
ncbi:hypothetical protein YQE_06204, partial [Dendroctonus ponderosae]